MKDLRTILERKDDTMVTIEPWADFLKIDLGTNSIEYLAVKEVKDDKVKKLNVGESIMIDDIIYVCI